LLENAVGHSDFLEYFHRPLIEHVRLGQHGSMGQRGHEDMLDVELREQHRCRQASATAAYDEYGCFNRHLLSSLDLNLILFVAVADAAQQF
jgi:hypothetical protein